MRNCVHPIKPSLELEISPTEDLSWCPCETSGMATEVTLHYSGKRWEFPSDPFVTYEPDDEPWCRALGIGREVECETRVTLPAATIEFCDGVIYFRALMSPGNCSPCVVV